MLTSFLFVEVIYCFLRILSRKSKQKKLFFCLSKQRRLRQAQNCKRTPKIFMILSKGNSQLETQFLLAVLNEICLWKTEMTQEEGSCKLDYSKQPYVQQYLKQTLNLVRQVVYTWAGYLCHNIFQNCRKTHPKNKQFIPPHMGFSRHVLFQVMPVFMALTE